MAPSRQMFSLVVRFLGLDGKRLLRRLSKLGADDLTFKGLAEGDFENNNFLQALVGRKNCM